MEFVTPLEDETTPVLQDDETVVFWDYFPSRAVVLSGPYFARAYCEVSYADASSDTQRHHLAVKILLGR